MLISKRHAIDLGAFHAIVTLGDVEDTVDGCLHSLLRATCQGVARAVERSDPIVERAIDSSSSNAPRGRKRARSPSTSSYFEAPKVNGREAADDGEIQHPSVRTVDPQTQTHASDPDKGVEKPTNRDECELTFEEGLAGRKHTNIIYLLTGKLPTPEIRDIETSQELDNHASSTTLRSGEAASKQRLHREALLATSKPLSENVCPAAISIAAFGADSAEISILPLTAENLAKIPDVERLRTQSEKETDKVVDKLKGLQHQMKSMIVSLREQRLLERQLRDEAEGNAPVSYPRSPLQMALE